MTDSLKERLREFVNGGLKRMAFNEDLNGSDYDYGSILIFQAADEIERLRARIAKLIDSYGQDDVVGQGGGKETLTPSQLHAILDDCEDD